MAFFGAVSPLAADSRGRFGEHRKLAARSLWAEDQRKLAEAGMGGSRDTSVTGGRPVGTGDWENN